MAPAPISPYGITKLAGELYAQVFTGVYGLETVSLRYFNVFGPRQDASSPYSGVISLFITALLAGGTPVIYGDGKQTRDFTYVDNVVDANLRALTAKGLAGQSVNVATGRRISLLALLRGVARETGRPAKARHAKPRAGDIRHSVADVTRAKKLLGYRVVTDFDEGLRRTVEWYRSQQPSARG